MKIHEYQAKELFQKYNIPTQGGIVIEDATKADEAVDKLGGNLWVVKAQVHAGGRGKGGGVKLAKNKEEVIKYVKQILGMTLITAQTGEEGILVRKVYIAKAEDIKKEYYFGIVLDRNLEMPVMIASTEGGVEIEKIAKESPEKIHKVAIDPQIGICDFQIRELAKTLNFNKIVSRRFSLFARNLYQFYMNSDAEMVEINPMILTDDDQLIALDAKVSFDDNALGRHKDIAEMQDFFEEEESEIEAHKYGLNYIKLDGNVGCMVNGAGLAMSTMDIIKDEGGEPANFLDVGGNANAETVAKGFELILKDSNVKAIFVNIFGGIVRCDRIANGIIKATEITEVKVPVIVRLEGTNSKEALEILRKVNIANLISANDLKDGAKKSVQTAIGV
ncbi:MAG: ADP-forming succinate--CoA ligase subunit beta [Candidatus Cloacimonetes bacterium]|nr:ADP-forming succinate--CoA ligase subunit beta [Candidatus Cloacimonadota bacterium]